MQVVFESCGTESINHVIRGVLEHPAAAQKRHIITTAVEHVAVHEVCKYAEAHLGATVTLLPVDSTGQVTAQQVEAAITDETVLVSVMLANNEVGTLQPVAEISKVCRGRNVLVHTDASQAIGKIPVDVGELGVDFLTVAGHKLYAPKGVGATYIRAGAPVARLMHGAGHEAGRRAGTENVLFWAALGTACRLAKEELPERMAKMKACRDLLKSLLIEDLGEDKIRVNGHPEACLPNTLSIGFRGCSATAMMQHCSSTMCCSAGSACHAGAGDKASHVLRAMGIPDEFALGTLRLSCGLSTTEDKIRAAAAAIASAVRAQG